MSHNTWIHRGVRTLVRPLVGTPVTPNQITALRLLTGMGAAAAFATGEAFWQNVGGAIFVLSLVLDRADGELARLGGKTSLWGHRFDLIADGLANGLVFVGIGVGLRESVLAYWALPMGVLAGGAVAAVLWLVVRVENSQGPRALELPAAGGFDADDAMLAVPIAVWLGGAVPLLIAAAIGAPVFAALFFWRHRRNGVSAEG